MSDTKQETVYQTFAREFNENIIQTLRILIILIELICKNNNLVQIIRIGDQPKIKPTRHQHKNRNNSPNLIILGVNENPGQRHHHIRDTTTKRQGHRRQQPIGHHIHRKKHQTNYMVCGHLYERLFLQPAQQCLGNAIEVVAQLKRVVES